MGNTPLLNEYTVPYGTVLTTAAPMFALSSFLQAFVRNDGAPKLAMAGVISGGVTNVILDYVYIFIMKVIRGLKKILPNIRKTADRASTTQSAAVK